MRFTISNIIIIALLTFSSQLLAVNSTYAVLDSRNEIRTIKNINGKLYAYIVLLFNNNPHFVNLIQKDSISPDAVENEDYKLKAYKHYLGTIEFRKIKRLAYRVFHLYKYFSQYSDKKLFSVEQALSQKNIVLRFSRENKRNNQTPTLDYCIFGKRRIIKIKHPFFTLDKVYYNIQPFIYYDEFSTSNSTFYFDMVYINPDEVNNDYLIARNILKNRPVKTMFFVGSKITEEIRFCLKRAFRSTGTIRKEIWKMFIIHELTHKILNNKFENINHIDGEILSLCSTIYSNPYLGLSVLYSYINYNNINPHRIAAEKLISFIADNENKKELINNPSLLKHIPRQKLKKLAKNYFYFVLNDNSKNLNE